MPGDYLVRIATEFYGDPNKWRIIYEANVDVIGPDPDLIYPGQVMTIPTS
jgi:nucleoid-associated protein YgaU